MHTTPQQRSTLAASFLQRLRVEEDLLADALASANELYAALRRGDTTAATATTARQRANAASLHDAGAARAIAAGALAHALGIPADGLKLTALAEKLPDDLGAEVLAARERLATVTAELATIQTRNANLLAHLRSFFRGVLSDLTADDTPARYGPSGSWLAPVPGATLPARGTHS